jgi:hypothetical protein
VAFNIIDASGVVLANCNTRDVGSDVDVIQSGRTFVCEIAKFPLRRGRYSGNLYGECGGAPADWLKEAFTFNVEDGDFFGFGSLTQQGKLVFPYEWKLR